MKANRGCELAPSSCDGAARDEWSSTSLPNRLLTVAEVASFIGCHEETVRRAYLRGLLRSQRFGSRGRRFYRADVLDWLTRGAPTTTSRACAAMGR